MAERTPARGSEAGPPRGLTHQDVEEETAHLKGVYDRLPEGEPAEQARWLLGRAERAAHEAVETRGAGSPQGRGSHA